MILTRPFPKSTITQHFGDNATALYASQGDLGHEGEDYGVPWGTPVPSAADNAYCYSTLNKDNPDLSKYRTPCFLIDEPDGVTAYELIYGHASDILAIPGRMYHKADIVSKVGNTGPVFVGSHEVTSQEKLGSGHPGSHLHFQVRALTKVKKMNPGKQYILDGNGILKRDGWYYEVTNYNNGYKGCIDPEQFFAEKPTSYIFSRDLSIGSVGEDVRQLQKYLNIHNFTVASHGAGSVDNETTTFGSLTRQALMRFQKAHNISPSAGYFGAVTRAYIANNP